MVPTIRGRTLRWRLTGATVLSVSAIPAVVLLGYFVADLHLTAMALLLDLGAILLGAPVLGAALAWITGPLDRALWTALDRLDAGQSLSDREWNRARRAVFRAPWIAAARTALVWVLGLPGLLWECGVIGGHRSPIHFFVFDGLALGPLVAMAMLFAAEIVLRPAVARLFPDGGVDRFRTAFTLSLRTRTLISTLFLGPYSVGLLAMLTHRRVSVSHTIFIAVHRLFPLETYMVLLTAFLVVLLLAFSRINTGIPLERLVAALRRVQEGDLEAHLPVESNDQLGIVTDRFNAMVQGLRDRERMREAFGRFVSPELAKRATTGELVLGGETREVTVLFSDVRNFTAMSERMAPNQLVELMNRYFEAMVPCISTNGGYMNKFIGDGIMALFGAPLGIEDHAEAALRAALAMEEALEKFNTQQKRSGLPELAIGVGIATGPVVVGVVGSQSRQEYTAIGDTVNTASRIEGLNKEFGTTILLEEVAAARVGDRLPLRQVGTTKVKGKERPVTVYGPAAVAVKVPAV